MMVCWFLLENSFSYVDQNVDNLMQTTVTKLVVNDCSPVKWSLNMRAKKSIYLSVWRYILNCLRLPLLQFPTATMSRRVVFGVNNHISCRI